MAVRGEPGQLRLADRGVVGGQLYPRAALYQTGFHNTYDVNLVEVGDFGQWRVGWQPGDTQTETAMATDAARGYI